MQESAGAEVKKCSATSQNDTSHYLRPPGRARIMSTFKYANMFYALRFAFYTLGGPCDPKQATAAQLHVLPRRPAGVGLRRHFDRLPFGRERRRQISAAGRD